MASMFEEKEDGFVVDAVTVQRLEVFAAHENIERGDAFRAALSRGLDYLEGEKLEREDRLAAVERELSDLKVMVNEAGKAALATRMLLAAWMSKVPEIGLNEDQIEDELKAGADTEWTGLLLASGVLLPRSGV
jgi:hypothetical protein